MQVFTKRKPVNNILLIGNHYLLPQMYPVEDGYYQAEDLKI